MKALVGTINQEKALVGAFSVIVQLHRLIVYTALVITMIQWQLCSPQLPAQPGRLPAVLAVPLHPGRCSPLHALQGGRRLHQVTE